MTTNYHTSIATGAADNAATFNSPLGQLDSALTTANTDIAARVKKYTGKTTAPTINDDSGDGFVIGDVWVDETNDRVYWCNDNTLGAAVWLEIGNKNKSTVMDGMQLIWNSATSVSVGTGSCFAENGDFINVTSAIVKSSLSLAINTWYHIYVYLSAGAAAAEVVTTAPVAWKGTAYSKTGDTSRRYVGSIRSDASGNVYEFIHNPATGIVMYKNVSAAASPFRCLSAGTATTATAVALSAVTPVTSRAAKLRFFNGGTQACYTNEGNTVSTTLYYAGILAIAIQQHIDHPVDSSQQVYYLVTAGGTLYIDVVGYLYYR